VRHHATNHDEDLDDSGLLREMNHYSHQMCWGLRISLIKKLGASMMVRCCNVCTMLFKCCGMLISTSVHTFWISEAEAVHWRFKETPLSWLLEVLLPLWWSKTSAA
jgi:hypothetical protein